MPKGQNTDSLTIYKIMLSYITTRNYSETARQLNMPESTVRNIVDKNKDTEEFAKLCEQKRDEFVEQADLIINKGIRLLNKRLDTALENQDELQELIYEVWNADKEEIDPQAKKGLVSKLSKLQLNSLNEITTAIGTLFDKKVIVQKGNTPEIVIPELKVKVVDNSGLEKYLYEEDE